eukprot:1242907-Pleurochrysis_carterae.AAC.2
MVGAPSVLLPTVLPTDSPSRRRRNNLPTLLPLFAARAQVPGPWGESGRGYPSLKPLASWFKDLVQRVDFMRTWLATGVPHLGTSSARAQMSAPDRHAALQHQGAPRSRANFTLFVAAAGTHASLTACAQTPPPARAIARTNLWLRPCTHP